MTWNIFKKKKYHIEAACGCHIGCVRKKNEDNFYFAGKNLSKENTALKSVHTVQWKETSRPLILGVFDGMGGHADGEVASFLAADTLKRAMEELGRNRWTDVEFLNDLIRKMNDVVWKRAEKENCNMGTTAALLSFRENTVTLCNVGDSPAFRLREGKLQKMSMDHTDAEFLRKNGITNRKPRLIQYLGISPEEMIIEPYLIKEKIQNEDRYLLCSDGLTDMVSQEEINEMMQSTASLKSCVEQLIGRALECGGSDNLTVIVAQVVQ